MTVLTLCRDGTIKVGHDVLESIADEIGDDKRPGITEPMLTTFSKVRREKIIEIRRQLDDGSYDLDERLDAVLERILIDIDT